MIFLKLFDALIISPGIATLFIWFSVLGLATFLSAELVDHYRVTGEQVIQKDAWQTAVRGEDTALVEDGQMSLFSRDAKNYTAGFQQVEVDSKVNMVMLSAGIRTLDVIRGDKPWKNARLLFVQYGRDNKRLRGAHVVVDLEGTHDWIYYEKGFDIHPDAKRFKVAAELLRCTGQMQVRDISLYPVEVPAPYVRVQQIMLAGWGGFFIFFLGTLLRQADKGFIPVGVVCFAAILFATMITGEIKLEVYNWISEHLRLAGFVDKEAINAVLGKGGHFVFFMMFGGVMGRFMPTASFPGLGLNVLMLAGGTELAQVYIEGRMPMFGDFMLDAAGGMLGLGLSRIRSVG